MILHAPMSFRGQIRIFGCPGHLCETGRIPLGCSGQFLDGQGRFGRWNLFWMSRVFSRTGMMIFGCPLSFLGRVVMI